MQSTYRVDFSVRQNKAIERALVFEGLSQLLPTRPASDYVYVGLGSIWFVDFDLAHRVLGIDDMISIEADTVLFERARYNSPYRTIEVLSGYSYDVIPRLLDSRPELTARPWIVWLDYDSALDETSLEEIDRLVIDLPDESILLTTFNAAGASYEGQVAARLQRLQSLFGDAFPSERFSSNRDVKNERKLMDALGDAVLSRMSATAVRSGRPGGFVPAFNLRYQDSAPMVTAGGVLPGPEPIRLNNARAVISDTQWIGVGDTPIVAPPLTQKEVGALRTLLPSATVPTRTDVQALGFDLLEEQIESFSEHYLRYPSFVQTSR